MTIDSPCDCDNELANDHAERTPDHDTSTTESFDDPKGERSRANVDESGDQRDEEWITDRSKLGKERGAEVEDEVYPCPLLHHLH